MNTGRGAPADSYLVDRIHFTSARTSSSGTWALGGIGTRPQTPEPPVFTYSPSLAAAAFCPADFLAPSA